RADRALYQEINRQLVAAGGKLDYLTVSFRAVPALQASINAPFAPLMTTDGPTHPAYTPLQPSRDDIASQPALVALPVPAPYGDYGRVVEFRIDDSLPDAVAAFASWLVQESRWTVTEREEPGRRL